ncbi:R3H domain protein [bacterium BMS3Abin01]|nr:R3H domain protein [bacterium BMS3Abin01]
MEENQEQKRNGADLRVEGSGKTVADAEADALSRLEETAGPYDRDRVELVVIEAGSKGFLGMGSNLARVEARLAAEAADTEGNVETGGEDDSETAKERLGRYLEKIIVAIGLEGSVEISEDEEAITGNVTGPNLGIFIGRHGQTIDAVQYIANIVSFRGLNNRKRIIIDAEDYRERRAEALESLAERGVNEIEKGMPEYEFKPMSAAERRIIHLYLQDREGVETESEGRDPFRRVIITRTDS